VTKLISLTDINLVTPKARAQHEHIYVQQTSYKSDSNITTKCGQTSSLTVAILVALKARAQHEQTLYKSDLNSMTKYDQTEISNSCNFGHT